MDDKANVKALESTPIPSELAFPRAEYEVRHARIRAAMDANVLAALLIVDPANIAADIPLDGIGANAHILENGGPWRDRC